jgi:cation/acetate symporter
MALFQPSRGNASGTQAVPPARSRPSGYPQVNFAFFPLNNPGIVSIPLAFFLGWLGTVTDKQPADSVRFARMQVRALTGAGAERGNRS